MDNISRQSFEIISGDLDLNTLENQDSLGEKEIIKLIADRVRVMMETEIELLFSYLYRLDVSEKAVRDILFKFKGEDAIFSIANLIWNRQKQRMETKKKYKQNDQIEGWEW
jgi:hypothetical protein